MKFNPKILPYNVKKIYKLGPLAWIYVIRVAINEGISDIDFLTDIAFYLHHPELKGRSLEIGETDLIESWTSFRSLIKPLLNEVPKIKKDRYRSGSAHFALMAAPFKNSGGNYS